MNTIGLFEKVVLLVPITIVAILLFVGIVKLAFWQLKKYYPKRYGCRGRYRAIAPGTTLWREERERIE